MAGTAISATNSNSGRHRVRSGATASPTQRILAGGCGKLTSRDCRARFIEKGSKFGDRVVELVCQHRTGPLELAPDCQCGIYVEDRDRAFQRWCLEVDRVGVDNVALTFGAAVGDVALDPVLPDDALRSPRYAILAILLPPASPVAGPVRKRYDANVPGGMASPDAVHWLRDSQLMSVCLQGKRIPGTDIAIQRL
jgi:hypothetical protein